METLKLSDLLKVGVKYFQVGSVTSIILNDGTKLLSQHTEWNNGEGSSGEDHDFVCLRDGVCYNVLDDVHRTLSQDERMGIGSVPKWSADHRHRLPMAVWSTDY